MELPVWAAGLRRCLAPRRSRGARKGTAWQARGQPEGPAVSQCPRFIKRCKQSSAGPDGSKAWFALPPCSQWWQGLSLGLAWAKGSRQTAHSITYSLKPGFLEQLSLCMALHRTRPDNCSPDPHGSQSSHVPLLSPHIFASSPCSSRRS
ncbi:hypothetical protein DPEC_G00253890 [Dallia pectoralis]|uniref:Uncharacterized protein n=1 Tax=Dallia pectoralis TaxID=75939 RepID=A0ACC2FUF1_DALPE|nr:hypothetical protein DPEC_G00253890 [Dallia pectoralis]